VQIWTLGSIIYFCSDSDGEAASHKTLQYPLDSSLIGSRSAASHSECAKHCTVLPASLCKWNPTVGQYCCVFKPKFHYADFPVTSTTSLQQTCDVPFIPNSITPTSPKLPVCVSVMELGLKGTSRGSRRSGIWALWCSLLWYSTPQCSTSVISVFMCQWITILDVGGGYGRYGWTCGPNRFAWCKVHRMATHFENLEKSGNLASVREKSGKLWFPCGVLMQLW